MSQRTRVELLAQLREELARPRSPRTITVDEYRHLQELAAFRCPIGIDPSICDGRACPTRPQLLCDLGLCSLGSRCRGSCAGCFTDYFDECSDARHARLKLKEVLRGDVAIFGKSDGWAVNYLPLKG